MRSSELLYLCEYLKSYVIEHFDPEEKQMYDAHYPRLTAHRRHHNEFRSACMELFANCRDRGTDKTWPLSLIKR